MKRIVLAGLALLIFPGVASAASPAPISSLACLRKMALNLTNRGPSEADIAAVKAGTKSLDAMADGYLDSPEFSTIALNWYRSEFEPSALMPEGTDVDEPARLARDLVTANRDFRELVTATYTVSADGAIVSIGPDAAGVLTTKNYMTAFQGILNRNWAGRILREMAGIVLAPVTDVPDNLDSGRDGLAKIPLCAGCHVNPIYGVDHVAVFRDCYDAKGARLASCTPASSSFLGKPGASIADLGRILADSVEWRAQTIQSIFVRFSGRQIGKNEIPRYRNLESTWVGAGYKPKALVKRIVTAPEYCMR